MKREIPALTSYFLQQNGHIYKEWHSSFHTVLISRVPFVFSCNLLGPIKIWCADTQNLFFCGMNSTFWVELVW